MKGKSRAACVFKKSDFLQMVLFSFLFAFGETMQSLTLLLSFYEHSSLQYHMMSRS